MSAVAPDRLALRTAFEALRAGVPNQAAVRLLGSVEDTIEERFEAGLGQLWSDTPAPGLLFAGGFGAGKSHLLGFLREVALQQNFVVSSVSISKETPLSAPLAVFTAALRDTIVRLMDAGLDSIPGGGAEILDDEVRRRIARLKCTTDEWLLMHRTAHSLGMRTTATMMFGCGETLEHRINHFERVRQLQEETGGFTAFIPWFYQRAHTSLGNFIKEEVTAVDYLKTLAVARIYLNNIENVQASWLTPGHKICQIALRFGGNDVGSILIEENVVRAAGVTRTSSEDQLRRMIEDAGFRPIKRDTLYHNYFLN